MNRRVRVPGFRPSTHAFRFGNSWPRVPVTTLRTPFGPVGIGNAAGGLCGGLAFATRDFFEAGLAVPVAEAGPEPGSPLFRYLVRRLWDSFDLPRGVLRFYRGQFPGHDPGRALAGTQWPLIRAELDAGRLVCLGVVRARSLNPRRLGRHHQVLAYGYDQDTTTGRVTLAVCDPNHHGDDEVTLGFATTGEPAVTYVVDGVAAGPGSSERTYGAFVEHYRHPEPSRVRPPAIGWGRCSG